MSPTQKLAQDIQQLILRSRDLAASEATLKTNANMLIQDCNHTLTQTRPVARQKFRHDTTELRHIHEQYKERVNNLADHIHGLRSRRDQAQHRLRDAQNHERDAQRDRARAQHKH
nr:hypothetical protein B0A51_08119 [Rachicladosporium sp. CCFEE 5018]OQO27439.1 hypothetical protein B0A51_06315 [Rachicladosporium sp. CCFEE 5018]